MVTPKQVLSLAGAMRSAGVVALKTPDIELVLGPVPTPPGTGPAPADVSPWREQDLRFAHTEGLPDDA